MFSRLPELFSVPTCVLDPGNMSTENTQPLHEGACRGLGSGVESIPGDRQRAGDAKGAPKDFPGLFRRMAVVGLDASPELSS